ncbi:hypothetical protein TrLO_g4723 [Triparma laevis f. longispina]|uniref:Fatty acid hydroxylase domain-containing protein n=1 Tax=Triparma laevis f. longispina TaxID=1714387 RepID=A0A9W7FB70_9STRA|nr:hypothetical protein TrLO_g4723 [Triparma laevis f. longispina]
MSSTQSFVITLLGLLMTTSQALVTESFPGQIWRMAGGSFATMVEASTYSPRVPFWKKTVEQSVSNDTQAHSKSGVEEVTLVNPFRNFNAWVNSFIFPETFANYLISNFGPDASHYMLCYIRNFVSGCIIYYVTAGIFHYRNYVLDKEKLFVGGGKRKKPSSEVILHQIKLAQSSLFLYVALPVFSDWLIEEGYTYCYYDVREVGGWGAWLGLTLIYFACVEIGIYWMHRTLHENKFLYKYVHSQHHAYNTPETLTPWASIAFNPLDGILQASPYVFILLVIPCHYLTHVLMVFCTAIWATYIHDTMDGNVEPIMSNKYHTVHHTHYIYNYGQIFIFCDWFWGTLKKPTGPTGTGLKRKTK